MCSALFVPGKEAVKTTDATHGVVLYSDGGCRPNPGIGGWGIHGYLYTAEVPKRGLGLAGKVATYNGYAPKTAVKESAQVTVVNYIDGYGSLIPMVTNNVAEVTGALEALRVAVRLHRSHGVVDVMIFSDSKYVIDGITKWVVGWASRNWTKSNGEEIANEALWRTLSDEQDKAIAMGINLNWEWVKGHSGDTGNETTDILATQGVIVGNKSLTKHEVWFSEAQGYWNDSQDYNRMLSLPRWYFNTHVLDDAKSGDDRWAYYIGDHGKDDDLAGKRMSDASFAVLYLAEQVPEILAVQNYQNSITPQRGSSFVIGQLKTLLQGSNLSNLRKNGDLFLHRAASKTNDLMLPRTTTVTNPEEEGTSSNLTYNGSFITKELNPPRLAFTLVESFYTIQTALDSFLGLSTEFPVVATEITDILYEVDHSKKAPVCKLSKEITSATKALDVEANYDIDGKKGKLKLTLRVGIDLINRNDLNALASRNPKAWVVTWEESSRAIRYATILQAEGDIGIWAGVYSNIGLLPVT